MDHEIISGKVNVGKNVFADMYENTYIYIYIFCIY
jgi:hypothetical protein